MSQHIYTYDPANDQLNEIGGAGHIIKDGSGTSFTKRENLQFDGCSVTDDSTNNATIIQPLDTNFVGTSQEFWNLTRAQRAQYKTVDLTDDFNGSPIDSALSTTSENPVQNKVITTAINGRAPEDHSSASSTYGVGSATKYGHVKVDDELSSTSTNPVQNKVVNSVFEAFTSERALFGVHNFCPLRLDKLKEINSGGTWNGNVFSILNFTITVNEADGSISIKSNGAASVTYNFTLSRLVTGGNIVNQDLYEKMFNKKIHIDGCPSGGASNTYCITMARYDAAGNLAYDTGNGTDFTYTKGATAGDSWIAITLYAGTTFNDMVFKPLICYQNEKDFPYQIPTKTNVELTQETTGLIDNALTNGAVNLMPSTITSQVITDNGANLTVLVNEDSNSKDYKAITINGTTGSALVKLRVNAIPISLPNNVYKISGCPTGGSQNTYRLMLNDGQGNAKAVDDGDGGTYNKTTDITLYFLITLGAGITFNNLVFKPMLTLADQPNSDYAHYVPYAKTNRELTEETQYLEEMTGGTSGVYPYRYLSGTYTTIESIPNGFWIVPGPTTSNLTDIPSEILGRLYLRKAIASDEYFIEVIVPYKKAIYYKFVYGATSGWYKITPSIVS